MTTKVELDRAGAKVRVYHETRGRGRGAQVTAAWTHPYAERATCETCQKEK